MANALVIETEHPGAGLLRQTRAPARFNGTPLDTPAPAPALGAHTAEVLGEAGLTQTEIAALIDTGAAIRPAA